ncbi:MarR family transcriptional regulator (plasmid) [Ensifer adhaerens]|uniref:MarR family winged helix-turn-helix transcriptional regulator n=1 Tax=Ensifer adhaerens TaxID=106592 RepID=UPI00210109E2|nr:MarR family transcriptional regulator [Ensifer adhaerens]UTV41798.1 MarR family transcriptional regulator [Ensifer adhaerens]
MDSTNHNSAGAWAKKFHLAARSAIEATLKPYDLGSTQWYALRHLFRDGPLAQSDLLKRLQVEKATLSGVISVLVRKGLVEQTTDPNDHRQKLLSITSAGRTLWENLPDPIDLIRKTAFEGIPESDIATAVRVLSAGAERLNTFLKNGKKS